MQGFLIFLTFVIETVCRLEAVLLVGQDARAEENRMWRSMHHCRPFVNIWVICL